MGVPTAVVCCIIAGIVIFLVFTSAFFVELLINDKSKKVVKEIRKKNERPEIQEDKDLDIDNILKSIEQKTVLKEEKKINAEPKTDLIIEKKEVIKEENEDEQDDFSKLLRDLMNSKNTTEEKKVVEEVKPVEEKKVEVVETKKEDAKPKDAKPTIIIQSVVYDYTSRIEKVKENLAKLDKDLTKSTREVNKYEKVEKRKTRNEKLLDKKTTELTNLNLILYNVNDIKEIDPEKKEKQVDLSDHVAELKTAISDAKTYLQVNKEKYVNAVKMRDFLVNEKGNLEQELKELTELVKKSKKN